MSNFRAFLKKRASSLPKKCTPLWDGESASLKEAHLPHPRVRFPFLRRSDFPLLRK